MILAKDSRPNKDAIPPGTSLPDVLNPETVEPLHGY